MNAKWAIRCDAGPDIGCGHVMRMIAFAEAALEQNIKIIWLVNPNAAEIIRARKNQSLHINEMIFEQTSQEQIEQVVTQQRIDLTVFDGYHFQGDYLEQLVKGLECVVAILDDNADINWPKVDCIINGGFGAKQLDYTKVLEADYFITGPEYYLLRHEFLAYQDCMGLNQPESYRSAAKHCLVMFGGSDPMKLTDWFVRQGNHWPRNVSFSVLIGEQTSLSDESIHAIKLNDGMSLIYSTTNMAELIAQHDFVISAAGGTLYECAFFEKCTLAIVIALNQNRAGQAISEALFWPPPVSILDSDFREEILVHSIQNFIEQEIQRPVGYINTEIEDRIIDGLGAQRVVTELVEYTQMRHS